MQSRRQAWRRLLNPDVMLLFAAAAAGVAGAVLSSRYLGASAAQIESKLRHRYEPRPVVVSAMDLPAGEMLDASRLAIRKVPREFLPADAVPAERAGELIGGHTAIPISRGSPVVTAALKSTIATPRLSTVLGSDRRALTIAVDQVNSQAGNIAPGDWVDLFYSQSTGGESVLVPLLQHVEVLAAGASLVERSGAPAAGEADREFSTITLELSAEDAARITLAQQSGLLSVVLRSPADSSVLPADPRSSRELLRRPSRASAPAVDPRVELLVGGQGELVPARSWLAPGQGRAGSGDAS